MAAGQCPGPAECARCSGADGGAEQTRPSHRSARSQTRAPHRNGLPLHVSHTVTCSTAHAAAPMPFSEPRVHESRAIRKLLKRTVACGVSGSDVTRQRNKQSIQSPQYRRAIEPEPTSATLGRKRTSVGAATALWVNKKLLIRLSLNPVQMRLERRSGSVCRKRWTSLGAASRSRLWVESS